MARRRYTISQNFSRRDLLKQGGLFFCSLAFGGLSSCGDTSLFSQTQDPFVRPARHWRSLGKGTVECLLCPNGCQLNTGERGICRVRMNRGGTLYTLVYSRIAALHIDPIEKKPFFHFVPGSNALSVATAGCNLHCLFCQNWQLSQAAPESLEAERITPQNLAQRAVSTASPVIAFTYNEPTVQFEYIVDAAHRARIAGVKPVIVSNGYIKPSPGREFSQALDGIKIDLKAFTQNFYSDICGGSLNDVLANLELIHASGRWLEIVVLVIPSLNDSSSEIRNMTRWIRTNLSRDVPVHFLRFQPLYHMTNLPPTPVSTLERCHRIARAEGIRYAYIGNVPGHRFENTFCHQCGHEVITRAGIIMTQNRLQNGRCPSCHTRIPGVWA